MAGCYHDQEDFHSDMKVEIAKEDEIVKEGNDLDDFKCEKNPRHDDFIPFKDLTLEDLPQNHRTMEKLNLIKTGGNTVVRVVVDKMENGKWIKISGTGYVVKMMNRYCITTNNHVVKTNEDVKNCTVEFFYDSHDKSKVIKSRGVIICFTYPYRDLTLFEIHPVHDSIQQLDMYHYDPLDPYIVLSDENNPFVTGISDQFRRSSDVVQYARLNINDPNIQIMFLWFKDKSFGYLKSSYFRFQPIPSNIHDITNIEIHVDEDDGNSTVISGDVVQFGDEYVVKISESIFQDKVKRCRLVWNGEVIGRGTRLYFEQMKSGERSSFSFDVEFDINMTVTYNRWIFHFSREENYLAMGELKRFSNLYCIGHPHGGIKMVTFGMLLGISTKHFDKKGRHINHTRHDCRCEKIQFANYSSKTCPGSSGSPVFTLDGIAHKRGLTHFKGSRQTDVLPNGQIVENRNTGWLEFNLKPIQNKD